jgi:DNA-binding HxlR family transcriptional regulator
MLGKTYDAEICSISRALEFVGERWSLLIIRDAVFAATTRYSDFQRSLGIATNVLQDRLDGFVAAGLMRREPVTGQPDLHEYLLTEMGRDLTGALVALTEWGDTWAAPEGPPIRYTHATCGAGVGQQLVCDTCGAITDPAEVQAQPGPGMPTEHLERKNNARRARPRSVAVPGQA